MILQNFWMMACGMTHLEESTLIMLQMGKKLLVAAMICLKKLILLQQRESIQTTIERLNNTLICILTLESSQANFIRERLQRAELGSP
uniref:tRNA ISOPENTENYLTRANSFERASE family protein n=2 Tax=Rhizophora mucronata TaxID=61149 RepID=A0A2P2K5U3_RHIMU